MHTPPCFFKVFINRFLSSHSKSVWSNFIFKLSKILGPMHVCSICQKAYKHKASLWNHKTFECGKSKEFTCYYPGCGYSSKLKGNLKKHIRRQHFEPVEFNMWILTFDALFRKFCFFYDIGNELILLMLLTHLFHSNITVNIFSFLKLIWNFKSFINFSGGLIPYQCTAALLTLH